MPVVSRDDVQAAIADAVGETPAALLRDVLERARFWHYLESVSRGTPADVHILIKPDVSALDPAAPTATDPRLVEALIDQLHERGYATVAVGATADSSSVWSDNRDVLAVADLLGYRFTTDGAHGYEFLDLAEDLSPLSLPPGSCLYGSSVSRHWADADVRIVFGKNKTDDKDGFRACLDTLLGVLPLADKDYYYRSRYDPATVALELLRSVPPTFALIDAIASCHGSGGSRAPKSIATHTIIGSRSAILCDFVGALKMGIDPSVSPIMSAALSTVGLPPRYTIDGNLAVYPGWQPVQPIVLASTNARDAWVSVGRTVAPWVQRVDQTVFPFRDPIDAQVNAEVQARLKDVDDDPASLAVYTLLNYVVGWLHEGVQRYRVLNDKDSLRQVHVPLGFDPGGMDRSEYEAPLAELLQLREVLRDVAPASNALRWRYVNRAVVFEVETDYPVSFDEFVSAIDVSRAIQYMNDYIGGIAVPVARDGAGRVTHQAERNLYLPQPNYLVLAQGQVIDVSKVEYVQYTDDVHRMSWKTIKSENGSAVHDDGLITVSRAHGRTHVTIFGRQSFTLPPFWKALNLDLVPRVKADLVTHAYTTFFQRTFANFEALLEGRDVRIGRPWQTPAGSSGTEPLLSTRLAERARDLLQQHGSLLTNATARPRPTPRHIDADGFAHFDPPAGGDGAPPAMDEEDSIQRIIASALTGLFAAARRDMEQFDRHSRARE